MSRGLRVCQNRAMTVPILSCRHRWAAFGVAGLLAACAAPPSSAPDTPAQSVARRELDAMHQALLDAHPGAIDDENPGYRVRIDAAHAAALARLREVRDEHDAMGLADWYAASFHDVHLHHSNNVVLGDASIVDGWNVGRADDGRVRVTVVLPDWPVALPPVGAELLSCDGRAPDRLVDEDVLAYVPPVQPSQRDALALPALTRPAMSSLQWKSCRFRLADGLEVDLEQRYRSVGEAGLDVFRAQLPHATAARVNDFEVLPDGTLWIHAADFQLDAAGQASLVDMLARLEKLPPPRRIVFDARGNGGGSSDTGDSIFDAATGGLAYDEDGIDQLPRMRAWWRVSPQAMAAREPIVAQVEAARGADDTSVKDEHARWQREREAMARGERWVPQGDGLPVLAPAELVRRHAHLARFAGPIALLTDGNCYSACLDFADRVRSVPGAIHLGETTGFDSVYLDIGWLALPSGNALVLPLKVWRNRLRGNDQPWVPQIPIKVTGVDEARVRAEVLAALDRASR